MELLCSLAKVSFITVNNLYMESWKLELAGALYQKQCKKRLSMDWQVTGLAKRGCLNASKQLPSSLAALAVAFATLLRLLLTRLEL